jgi:hypothetical protein
MATALSGHVNSEFHAHAEPWAGDPPASTPTFPKRQGVPPNQNGFTALRDTLAIFGWAQPLNALFCR